MKVYHGSKELFDQFDYGKIGTNGTMEGKGFYFTDSKAIADGYGQNGYVYTVEFKGRNSLHSDKKEITRKQLEKYLKALDEKTDYLSNWGEVAYDGYNKVMQEAVRGEYDGSDNDVDMISGIANACGNMEVALTLVYEVLGYDSIVLDAEWGSDQRLYIALVNDIIEIVNVESRK